MTRAALGSSSPLGNGAAVREFDDGRGALLLGHHNSSSDFVQSVTDAAARGHGGGGEGPGPPAAQGTARLARGAHALSPPSEHHRSWPCGHVRRCCSAAGWACGAAAGVRAPHPRAHASVHGERPPGSERLASLGEGPGCHLTRSRWAPGWTLHIWHQASTRRAPRAGLTSAEGGYDHSAAPPPRRGRRWPSSASWQAWCSPTRTSSRPT